MSDVIFIGTTAQLHTANDVMNIDMAGTNVHPTEKLKPLEIILDSHVTAHALAVRKACNSHVWALLQIRQLYLHSIWQIH